LGSISTSEYSLVFRTRSDRRIEARMLTRIRVQPLGLFLTRAWQWQVASPVYKGCTKTNQPLF